MSYSGAVAINASLFSERLCFDIIVLNFEMIRPFFNGCDKIFEEKRIDSFKLRCAIKGKNLKLQPVKRNICFTFELKYLFMQD
jgi:hypothetical protein